MKTNLIASFSIAANCVLTACGSGGGYGETKVTYSGKPIIQEPVDHGCGTVPGYDIKCTPLRPLFPGDPGYEEPTYTLPPELLALMPKERALGPNFRTWKETPAMTSPQLDSVEANVSYYWDQSARLIRQTYGADTQSVGRLSWGPVYNANGQLEELPAPPGQGTLWAFRNTPWNYTFGNLAEVGQPGIDLVSSIEVTANVTRSLTTTYSTSVDQLALIANPQALDWNYQSFGVWGSPNGGAQLRSFGAATPASSIPATGSASFSGKLAGLYVSPQGAGSTATADLAVNVNFGARTLDFASTGSVLGTSAASKVSAPNLNLGGQLTYSPGSNSFSGTLTNAGGTMSGKSTGQFYGPAAQELGGVFAVKSPTGIETFSGAYGAKR